MFVLDRIFLELGTALLSPNVGTVSLCKADIVADRQPTSESALQGLSRRTQKKDVTEPTGRTDPFSNGSLHQVQKGP